MSSLKILVGLSPIAVRQQIKPGTTVGGVAPIVGATLLDVVANDGDMYKYGDPTTRAVVVADDGGEFVFEPGSAGGGLRLIEIHAECGTASVISAAIVDGDSAFASLVLGDLVAAPNSAIVLTAVTIGAAGNDISAEVIDSAGGGLTVAVVAQKITIDLGGATPDATTVKAAIDGHGPAAALVTTALGGTGAGAVTLQTLANLTGGVGDDDGLHSRSVLAAQSGVDNSYRFTEPVYMLPNQQLQITEDTKGTPPGGIDKFITVYARRP